MGWNDARVVLLPRDRRLVVTHDYDDCRTEDGSPLRMIRSEKIEVDKADSDISGQENPNGLLFSVVSDWLTNHGWTVHEVHPKGSITWQKEDMHLYAFPDGLWLRKLTVNFRLRRTIPSEIWQSWTALITSFVDDLGVRLVDTRTCEEAPPSQLVEVMMKLDTVQEFSERFGWNK